MSEQSITALMERGVIPNFVGISNFKDIQCRFIKSARSIMLEYDLVRSEHHWQITALELYLYEKNIWPDDTTHGIKFKTNEQLESGNWYVHRSGKLARKRLGIDITAGSKYPEIHAGLLIGAIGNTDGSGRAVKSILGASSWKYSDTEMEFLKNIIHGKPIICDAPSLRLELRSAPEKSQLWLGPRKNLPRSTSDQFRNCCLRVATWQTSKDMMQLKEEMCSA